MPTLKIYEGGDSVLTYDGQATINLTPLKAGLTIVINSKDKLVLTTLDLTDIKRLAWEAMRLTQQHGELRDKLAP
jgi:hypothetical protein